MSSSQKSEHTLFHSLALISLSNAALQLLGFVFRILLARSISAEALGTYQLLLPFYSVLTSITLTGLTVAVSRLSASYNKRGDRNSAVFSVYRARRLFFFALSLIAVPVIFFRREISEKLLSVGGASLSFFPLLICLFLTGIENISKQFFYGIGKVLPQIVTELSEQVVRAFAVLSLLKFFSPESPTDASFLIVSGMVISELLSVFILSLFFRRERRGVIKSSRPKYAKLLSISLPISLAAFFNNLLSMANSALIPSGLRHFGMSTVAATESFGVMFGMTFPLLSFPIAFIASLGSVMVPKMSQTLAQNNMSDLRRKAGKSIHTVSLIAMPFFALVIELAKPICELLWKSSDPSRFILPLALGTLFTYYEIVCGSLLNAIGSERESALYIILCGIVQLLFTFAVKSFGMSAFVCGFVVSNLLGALLNILGLVRKTKLRFRFSNWFLRPIVASAVCLFISGIVYRGAESLLLSAISGLLAYYLTLSALGTDFFRYIKAINRR